MQQVLALEIDFGAPEFFGKPLGEIERRGSAGEVLEQRCELSLKGSVCLGRVVFVLEFDQRGHQRLGHIAAAVNAEAAGPRFGGSRWKNDRCHGASCLAHPEVGIFSVLGVQEGVAQVCSRASLNCSTSSNGVPAAHKGHSDWVHRLLGRVARHSRGTFLLEAYADADVPTVSSDPIATIFASQSNNSSNVPRTADPALMTSLTRPTRFCRRSFRRVFG